METLMLTIVFCVPALTGVISGADFLTVFTVVIVFYFGTQSEKNTATHYTGQQQSESVPAPVGAAHIAQGTVDSATANKVHPPDLDEMAPIGFER